MAELDPPGMNMGGSPRPTSYSLDSELTIRYDLQQGIGPVCPHCSLPLDSERTGGGQIVRLSCPHCERFLLYRVYFERPEETG